MRKWHVARTGNHQGLVIDDNTGKNIAVTYDKADAPLVAAAPALLEACERARNEIQRLASKYNIGKTIGDTYSLWKELNELLDNIRGESP